MALVELPQQPFLTTTALAQMTAVSEPTIRRCCVDGTLKGFKLGTGRGADWRIHINSAAQFVGAANVVLPLLPPTGLGVQALASRWACGRVTILHLIQRQALQAVRLRKRWRISIDEINRFEGGV